MHEPDIPWYGMTPAGAVTPWPRAIPVRLEPERRDELFVMTLGVVETTLADGLFDPLADRVTKLDGTTIEGYYAKKLTIDYYRPIRKSTYLTPPSGWCSWYYYFHEITPAELLANAKWLSDNLRLYGVSIVQLDDGWQGAGRGLGENRDWTTINERFREPGLAGVAAAIRSAGFTPGIWIAPHGQSNERIARESGAFLLKPDGSSASSTWVGDFLLDPTSRQSWDYLVELFTRLRETGFEYFKIDGQPMVISEFARNGEFMRAVPTTQPATKAAAELYRSTLRAMRKAIEDAYLLGCWGVPLDGVGLLNGSRTGGDVVPAYSGYLAAVDTIQAWNFLHNIVWYCDPDCLLVRPPLSDATARSWTTALGMTGQALFDSDRLMDLPASRVELLRRVYPPADIRPLDLFKPTQPRKPIWLLKVAQPLFGGYQPPAIPRMRHYDVVGVFNFDERETATRHVRWSDLGLHADRAYHVYDFWSQTYLGAWDAGVFVDVPPGDVRVLTLVEDDGKPTLLSTNRHITQGWTEIIDYERGGDDQRPVVKGHSRMLHTEPYVLTFGLPRAAPTYKAVSVTVTPASTKTPVTTALTNSLGVATLRIDSKWAQEIHWEVVFERDNSPYVYPVASPSGIDVEPIGLDAARLTWDAQPQTKAAYQVRVNGKPVGVAFEPHAIVEGLTPGREVKLEVDSLWYDGSRGVKAAERSYTPATPRRAWLSELPPAYAVQDWGALGRDRSVSGHGLRVGGEGFARGLGSHANATVRYRLYGAFTELTGKVGMDDGSGAPKPVAATFEIRVDGKQRWRSELVQSGEKARPFAVDVTGAEELELRVVAGEGGIDHAHADWLDVELRAK